MRVRARNLKRLKRKVYYLSRKLRLLAGVKRRRKLRVKNLKGYWGSSYVDQNSGALAVVEGILYCSLVIAAAMALMYAISLRVT